MSGIMIQALQTKRVALGWIKRYNWDWRGAKKEFETGLLLQPGNARMMLGLAVVASSLGDSQEAIKLLHRALELDPFNNAALHRLGFIYYHAGMLDEARSTFQKLQHRAPNRLFVHENLSIVYILQGKNNIALKEAEQEVDSGFRLTALAMVYDAMGKTQRANEAVAELIAEYRSTSALPGCSSVCPPGR